MSYRILILEDDAALRELAGRVLKREGFRTEGVGSGEEAIARAAQDPPDLFLLDYGLPDMTAEEVIAALSRQGIKVPFIVMTGQGREEIAVRMMKLGARDYLAKGAPMVDLLPSVVKEAFARIEAEADLARAEKELQASEERFALLMQTMKDGLVIEDEKGLISFANDRFCRVMGCSGRELAGRRLPDFIAGPWSDMRSEAGAAGQAEAVSFETTVQGRKSEDVRLEVTTRELVDEDGRVKGRFSVITDITELRQLRERIQLKDGFEGMVGRDVLMLDFFKAIREAATCDYPVLVQGESGTGKELAAVAVHNLSSRSGRPFVPVNCGVLTDNLIESELFGHVKGAFTGAIRDKKGRLEIAHQGTLFLDEIGDLSPALQVKFLRFLQEGTFERLGDEKTTRVDVRVVSATNKDLNKEVAKGRFREDLFFRLSTFPVTVPALRERPADIPLLVEHIVRKVAEKMRLEPVEVLPGVRAVLTAHSWPGNVRELENAITYALIKSRKGAIDIHHLPESIGGKTAEPLIARGRRRKVSMEAVRAALERTGGNMSAAARMLGISRATLYRIVGRHS